MEFDDIREAYKDQIAQIKKASQRSWIWTVVAGVIGTLTIALFGMSGIAEAFVAKDIALINFWPAIGTMVAGITGLTVARQGIFVDVDRDIQVEDINARRSAEYGAKAIVKELETAGMAIRVEPKAAETQQAPKPQVMQAQEVARIEAQVLSFVKDR